MAKRRLLTIHAPVRITTALAEVLRTVAVEYGNPVAEMRSDGLVVYLDSWHSKAP